MVGQLTPESGSSSVHGRIPWGMFCQEKLNLTYLRVFGARAYIHVPKGNRKKMSRGLLLRGRPTLGERIPLKGMALKRRRQEDTPPLACGRGLVPSESSGRNGGASQGGWGCRKRIKKP
ncbi:hypothetical protein KFL_013910020 [Klebsormidium nitens]|uniref:Uncharacterized protein n=1 Tax=Klebsormidium nitens TaxID=105231 RepID=A0A1Y1IRE1_KLENI|nr:hypothetical protein KFL_013910020 [Klebsormidium nitens]|eukprot:GAQ93254.1 hypothetical protein KFL_013910020 [Klebsormidium nitens]